MCLYDIAGGFKKKAVNLIKYNHFALKQPGYHPPPWMLCLRSKPFHKTMVKQCQAVCF